MRIAVVTGASSGMGREFVRQIGYFYRDLDEILGDIQKKATAGTS